MMIMIFTKLFRILQNKNILLIVSSCIVSLLFLEIGLRLFYGNQPVYIFPQVIYKSTDYGFKLKPNQNGTYTVDKPVFTNSFGFRDVEWTIQKPKGYMRIMVLGDSLTFGNAVRLEDTYPKVLERKLIMLNSNIEVMNVGVGGWATYHELGFFKDEGIKFEPDMVIIGFYLNDFASRPKGQVIFSKDNRLESRPTWLRWIPYKYIFLFKRSALFAFMRDRLDVILMVLKGSPDGSTLLLQNKVDLAKDNNVQDTLTYILEIKRICEEKNITFLLAAIPSVNYFWFPKDSLDYIKMLKNYSKSNGIEFIDLADVFWQYEDTERFFIYPWDNHLSPEGHELVANQLYVKTRNLLKNRFSMMNH